VADVFISYSKQRRAETVTLAADLQQQGFSVWWDTDLSPGEKFRDVINAELARARAVIVIWSPPSVKSDWVISEAARAHRRGIMIGVCTPDLHTDEIPPPFDVLHTELVTKRAAIVGALAKMGILPSQRSETADGSAGPATRCAETKPRRWSRRAVGVAVIGAVSAGAAASVAVLYQRRSPGSPKNPIRTISGHEGSVASMAYTPDGRSLLSGSWDRTMRLWDLSTGNQLRVFDGHRNVVYGVAVLRNGRQAVSAGDDRQLKFWSLGDPHPLRELKGHQGEVWSVALLPDDSGALSGSLDCTLKLWSLADGTVLRTFQYESKVFSVAIVPGGAVAVSAATNVLQSWSLADGTRIRTFVGHEGAVKAIVALPDGRHALSAGDDGTIRLWDLPFGNELKKFIGHKKKVSSVAVSSSGRIALSGSEDLSAKLWDLSTGQVIQSFEGHRDPVESVAIAPDGRTAVTGSRDRTINLWDLTGTSSG
jgi:hypothetical protein